MVLKILKVLMRNFLGETRAKKVYYCFIVLNKKPLEKETLEEETLEEETLEEETLEEETTE